MKGDEPVALTFFLKHCPYQFAKFHADLTDRSDPASPNYGKWLDVEGVSAGGKPTSASPRYRAGVAVDGVEVDATISSQVKRASSPPRKPSRPSKTSSRAMGGEPGVDKFESVVSTTVPSAKVEEHLETTLHHHGHTERNAQVIRAVKAYSLPADVAKHVSVVGDLVRFPRLKPASLVKEVITSRDAVTMTRPGRSAASYSGFVNPHVLAERYGFEFPKLSHAKGNSLGLAEFQRQYYDDPDLDGLHEGL